MHSIASPAHRRFPTAAPRFGGLLAILAVAATLHAQPTLTAISTSNVGPNQVTLTLQSTATGTGYFTLLEGAGASAGTGQQTKDRLDGTGSAAARFGSLSLTANTSATYTVRNLKAATTYKICFTADDGSALQATAVTATVTTSGAVSLANTWTIVGSAGFTANQVDYLSLAFAPDGTPYLAYTDGANSSKATVRTFSGGSWSTVGSAGFSSGQASYLSLAVAPDGTPWVGYRDESILSGWGTVWKLSGGSWTVPDADGNASQQTASYLSLAFAPDGMPHLVFQGNGSSGKISAMYFNGSSWGPEGSNFSAGSASHLSLVFASDGSAYVAYRDEGNSDKATVLRSTDYPSGSIATWNAVGTAGFSAGAADYLRLAIAPDGTPYVAYMDASAGDKVTVMSYSGGSWSVVGSTGFSSGAAVNVSLAIASDGAPWIAYTDSDNGYKATVMSYSAGSWSVVGGGGISAGNAFYLNLAFAPDGTPYLAYKDVANSNKATVVKLNLNSAPAIASLGGDTLAFTEDSGAQVLDQGTAASVTDANNPASLNGGNVTVSIVTNRVSGEDVLSIRHQGTGAGQIGVSGSNVTYAGTTIGTFTGGSGTSDLVVTLNANSTLTNVGALLQNLTYNNTNSGNPSTSARTVRVTVTDDNGGTSANADLTVNVTAANDAPGVTHDGTLPAVDEDDFSYTGRVLNTLGITVSDADSGASVAGYAIVGNSIGSQGTWYHSSDGSNWTVVYSDVSNANALVLSPTDQLRFTQNTGATGEVRTLTFRALDNTYAGGFGEGKDVSSNGGTTAVSASTGTIGITINDVNVQPSLSSLDATPTFTEGGAAVRLDADVSVSDLDLSALNSGNGNYAGATLTIARNGGANAADTFSFSGGSFTVSGANLQSGGLTFATFTDSSGTLTVSFTSSGTIATGALVNDVLEHIDYSNTSDAPPASVTLVWTFNDGNSGNAQGTGAARSATVNQTVSLTGVNDAPTLTSVSALSGATEDTPYTVTYAALATAANEADPDSAPLSFRIEAVSTGTLTEGGVAVTAGATLLSTGESLVWTPAANANGTLNAFTVKAWDGALASATAVQVQVDVTAVDDPPTVTTPTNASVTTTDATLGGNVTGAGDTAITERGVVYAVTATNADPAIGGTGVTKLAASGTSTGVFTADVTGLAAGTGYSFKAYATNSTGTGYSSASTFTTAASSNVNLSALALSSGTLAPAFASGTTSYTATVTTATTSLTVTPTVADATATVKVNNVTVASGNASGAIALDLGTNTITTVVTAQDGTTTKTYTVTVTRPADYTITTSGGALVITDVSGNGDTVALSQSGGNLVVTVAGRTFTVDGASGSTGSASVALAGLTSIEVNGGTGNDTITVAAFSGSLPSLTLNGGIGNDTVNLNGDLTFAANASLDVDLQDDDATPGTDTVNVAAGANLVTSGTGTIKIKASRNLSLATGSSLETVNGGITLEANQQATATSGSFSGVSLANATVTSTGTGLVTVKGRGGNSGGGQLGVSLAAGGRISSSSSGTVTVNGTGGAGTGTSYGVSVDGAGATITSVTGAISITGQGSTSATGNFNMGIFVAHGGQVTSTGTGASAATITLNGTGGGGVEGSYGVQIYQKDGSNTRSEVSSIDGAIVITGHGGASATGATNDGIILLDGGRVTSTGTGANAATITLSGTGGGGSQYAHGIEIYLNDARVTSVAGNIALTGQGGGSPTSNYNAGVVIYNTGHVTSTGTGANAGTITIIGTGGAGTGENYGVDLESMAGVVGSVDGAIRLTGTAGDGGLANDSYAVTLGYPSGDGNPISVSSTGTAAIEFIADSLRILTSVATIDAGTNTVTIKPKTAGRLIDLGGADTATTLGLTDAELDRITAGTLVLGDSQSGNLTVSAAISRSAATAFSLHSSDTIAFNAALDSVGGTVSLNAPTIAGGKPTLTTPTRASLATTGATLGGNLTDPGALPVTERGVVYSITGTNAAPQIGGTGVTKISGQGTATGVFAVDVTGLAPGTAYSYAAYATNGAGTGYSSVGTFTTLSGSIDAAIVLGSLTQTYTGSPLAPAVTTSPGGLSVSLTFDGSFTRPVNAGTYSVVASVTDSNYSGSTSGTFTIAKAAATIALGGLSHTYDGSAKAATATTTPAGLAVTFTYDRSAAAPSAAGSHAVVATIANPNYTGVVTGTLTIAPIMLAPITVTAGNAVQLTASGVPAGQSGSWDRNGTVVANATTPDLILANVQPATAGLYTFTATSPGGDGATSEPVIVGLSTTDKVIGTGEQVGADIIHPNGNVYDQVLLEGSAATVTADKSQVTRISFVDLTNDIVQVEFSGAGTLSVVMDDASSPTPAANYNQPGVDYVRGHAGLVIAGANETSNLTVYSVGRITAVNQSLFKSDVTYDGVADLAFVAIQSTNGKFGGVRTGNVHFFASQGFTGLYAPGVAFAGPVNVGDVTAFDSAQPVLVLGSAATVNITGGDLFQDNGQPVQVSGFDRLLFVDGSTSQGTALSAQANRAKLVRDGVDVTDLLVKP